MKAWRGSLIVQHGELKNMVTEQVIYEQASTSFTSQHKQLQIGETPGPIKELGSRAQTVCGSEPDYLAGNARLPTLAQAVSAQ